MNSARTSNARIRTALLAAALVVAPALTAVPALADAPAQGPTSATGSVERGAAAPAQPYKVRARINKSEVVAEEGKVRITGSVMPRVKGLKVRLEQKVGSTRRWKPSGTTKVRPNGRFAFTDEPSNSGERLYRVVVPGAKGRLKGISKEMALDVWGWEPLAWQLYRAPAEKVVGGTPSVGTTPYRNSLVTQTAGEPGFVEFTLGRKCRSITFSTALTDMSITGSTGEAKLSVDGTAQVVRPLAIGVVPVEQKLDISNAFRIRFDLSATGTPSGQAAVLTPMVLCLW